MKNGEDPGLLDRMLIDLSLLNTDLEKAEKGGNASLQLKNFIDEIPGGFLIYKADDSEEILYANRSLIRIFACKTFKEFYKLTKGSFRGFVHPDDLETVEKSILKQIRASGSDLDYVEYRIVDKDGCTHWVEDYGHRIATENLGDIFYVFISDATSKMVKKLEKERKLQNIIEEYDNERKLIRQEHLQRLEVIEGLSVNYDSILYADIDSDKVLPYRLSTRLVHQFEHKLQEKPFRWFAEDYVKVWVHPEDRDFVRAMTAPEFIAQKLAETPTFYLNYRTVQNGETQYIQLRMVNVGKGDHVSQVVMGYRNVDEETLKALEQKKALEEALKTANFANVTRNAFLSNMTHDMRTPLNAIFGYVNLARKDFDSKKKLMRDLDNVETACKKMLNLVEQSLEFTYAESESFAFTESECNVQEMTTALLADIRDHADRKKIALCCDCSAVKHYSVRTDVDKLKRILEQLCDNAVKYTESGSITITVTEEDSELTEFGTYRFDIADTGVGMSREFLGKIFEPFARERNTTFSGEYGTGLGLPIARHLAEMLGGELTAVSEPGKGTVFTLTLTLKNKSAAPENAEPETDAAAVPPELTGTKILLVEDNEINLEIETEILEDAGFAIDPAENGEVAVKKVHNARPGEYSFVLMDIQMPVMDGHQATKAIRSLADPEKANIPIIALSANAFESDKRASAEIGMDAHLKKPMSLDELLKTVTEVFAARENGKRSNT